jgi:hypothetical protein
MTSLSIDIAAGVAPPDPVVELDALAHQLEATAARLEAQARRAGWPKRRRGARVFGAHGGGRTALVRGRVDRPGAAARSDNRASPARQQRRARGLGRSRASPRRVSCRRLRHEQSVRGRRECVPGVAQVDIFGRVAADGRLPRGRGVLDHDAAAVDDLSRPDLVSGAGLTVVAGMLRVGLANGEAVCAPRCCARG